MGLFSTIGTIVGGVAGVFAGNPALGAALGGTMGGLGDSAIEKKKAEEKAKEEQLRKELEIRNQASSQYAAQTTPMAQSTTEEQQGGGLWESALQGAEQMAGQVFGDMSKKMEKEKSQGQVNNQQVSGNQQDTQSKMKIAASMLSNNYGLYLNPTTTPNPTGQANIYEEIIKGIRGRY